MPGRTGTAQKACNPRDDGEFQVSSMPSKDLRKPGGREKKLARRPGSPLQLMRVMQRHPASTRLPGAALAAGEDAA
jgi:hypothetical protein